MGNISSADVQRAGVGLEFTAASAVVFVELPDEVSILLQAEDRAHRHGQQMAVNIYFLLARGTSDERKCVFHLKLHLLSVSLSLSLPLSLSLSLFLRPSVKALCQ